MTHENKAEIDIDIGQTKPSGNYQDNRGNIIKIDKKESPSGLNGYKRYTHTPLAGSYYVGGINYNGTQQNSIPVTASGYYEKSVTVYYLGYDDSNVLPLIVGLERTYSNKYDYYRRTNILASNRWKGEENRDVDQEGKLPKKLTEITSHLRELIVLNLSQTDGEYYANGDPDSPPKANQTTQVQVTHSTYETVYNKYLHRLQGKKLRVLSTKHGGKKIPFDPPVYGSEYNEACVYYWSLDSTYANPLLIQLGEEGNEYYITDKGTSWTKNDQINKNNLKSALDKLNCKKNNAHIVDLSQKHGSSRPTPYQCPSCSSKQVKVSTRDTTDYSCYYHLSSGGSIRGFRDKGMEQSGLTLTDRISIVYVYYYPRGPNGIPLLIYLLGSRWFERDPLDSNTWKQVSNVPPGPTNSSEILQLLKGILPTVTINVGKTGINASGQHTEYEDPSEQSKEKIKVKREDKDEGFVSFVHSVDKKDYFMVRQLTHNGSPLSGISSSSILNSVTAYYSGEGGFKVDDLLMIELVKRNGPKKYVYYSRGGEDKDGTSWSLLDKKEQTEKLGDSELTTRLKELKEKLDANKKKRRQGLGAGPSGAQGSAGPQDIGQQILDFITSNADEIGGGVAGTIGTGIVGFGVTDLYKFHFLSILSSGLLLFSISGLAPAYHKFRICAYVSLCASILGLGTKWLEDADDEPKGIAKILSRRAFSKFCQLTTLLSVTAFALS